MGQVKVDALKERLLTINPSAEITALQQVFNADSVSQFGLEEYDYIIDAIDSLKDMENKMPIDPDDKGNGSIVHITAIFGMMLAGLVVQDAVK